MLILQGLIAGIMVALRASMNILYRLYTERRANLAELTARHFDNFTLIDAVGYWQGIAEPSAVIEILGTDCGLHARVVALARNIREANDQTSVYLVRASCELTEITADAAVKINYLLRQTNGHTDAYDHDS